MVFQSKNFLKLQVMKRITLSIVLLLSFVVSRSIAQKPVVTVGDIAPGKVVNKKLTATSTTRAHIIENGRLTTNVPGCEIESYSFMIKTDAHTLCGPLRVSGPQLTPEIIRKMGETDGPGVYVYFDEIHVKYNDKSIVATPIILKYD
jgi:hypothetical protein